VIFGPPGTGKTLRLIAGATHKAFSPWRGERHREGRP
jgi:ATP-dependent 26S proteasome regulatory subunit